MKKINFKSPKYMLPAILYLPILFVGYMLIKTFNIDTSDTSDPRLKTTDYLSSELPEAHTDSVLGSKMDNTEAMYGKISELSGVQSVENDRDSLNKKEEYESRYNNQEADIVKRQQADMEEKKKLREMQERVRQERKNRSSSDDSFVAPVNNSEIARLERLRNERNWDRIDRDLSTGRNNRYTDGPDSESDHEDVPSSVGYDEDGNTTYRSRNNNFSSHAEQGSEGTSEKEEAPEKVVKKVRQNSDYFNTLGGNSSQSKLITAIIDENVKAVDGSRVRLRLLDDIEIGHVTVTKGTYLYATMSGFGKQRVNGKVESIFFNEDIMKVSLSIYDTDGLQGLYVPVSSFRETAKDVASSAMQGGNIMDNSTSSGTGGVKNWAKQVAQNTSQRVMTALGTAAKKNRVKLKYGTKVYLVDGSQQNRNR